MHEAVGRRVTALVVDGRLDGAGAATILATEPMTVHRLLGAQGRTGFRFGRDNPLSHDLVIIDETSMVSLPLLARLLEAVRPSARLVLVGDPFQLSSIEAGTVMADLVGPLDEGAPPVGPLTVRVTELVRGHRFGADTTTAELARAVRQGREDHVLDILGSGDPTVHWVPPDDRAARSDLHDLVVGAAHDVVTAALDGSASAALEAASRVKVLAAVRRGPNGLFDWSDEIAAAVRDLVPVGMRGGWPRLGTPVMVTGNDPVNHLSNGDVGVAIDDDGRWVAMADGDGIRRLSPARVGEWEPWWAMTIHKSQGSEFAHAAVALPTVDSPILTRELLYTAVTRGKPEVTVVASEAMIRTAVSRPVARASGLRDRLWPGA
jgi:exodeoxyribonuclease V alpha subunit